MAALKRKKTYPLNQSPLFKLGNRRRLAEILKTDQKTLHQLARIQSNGYTTWTETSSSGKKRRIENPHSRLKRLQAYLAALLSSIEPPDFLTCPVKGRSYVANARFHSGSAEIVTLDISAYFPSTTWKRAYWFFNKRMEMSSDVAWTLASLSTVDGHLPTGSPLSPILAYFSHEDVWLTVGKSVREAGCNLTLYMDDLTISGDTVPESLIWKIKQTVHGAGLRLNNSKQRRYSRGEGLVTGIAVTPNGIRPTKTSHLKLKSIQDELRVASDPVERTHLRMRLRGLRAQHRQVLQKL